MDPATRASAQRPWTVVIPVKGLADAKSRLAASADGPAADALALAFLLDTLAAVGATAQVAEIILATSDPQVVGVAHAHGCRAIDDTAHPGINAAALHAGAARPPGTSIAVLVSDLPCLTPQSLSSVLSSAAAYPVSFLADADGLGTAMWFATGDPGSGPCFGLRSRDRHVDSGAVDLVARHPEIAREWQPARLDVDTEAALDRAGRLGLGAHSRAALAGGVADVSVVTVMRRDDTTVTVVDEDGSVGVVDWERVAAAGLVDVRRGQRLCVATGDGAVRIRLP